MDLALTPEDIEKLKSRDDRFKVLDLGLKIEAELRDSVVIQMILDKAEQDANEALRALADVDPTDTKKIISLQARVYRAKFTFETINSAIQHGRVAGQSLSAEAQIDISDSSD